jgi:hypothetical protein
MRILFALFLILPSCISLEATLIGGYGTAIGIGASAGIALQGCEFVGPMGTAFGIHAMLIAQTIEVHKELKYYPECNDGTLYGSKTCINRMIQEDSGFTRWPLRRGK